MERIIRKNRKALVDEGKRLMLDEVLPSNDWEDVSELISEAFSDAAYTLNMWFDRWGMVKPLTEKETEELKSRYFTEDKLAYLWTIGKIYATDSYDNIDDDEEPTTYMPSLGDLYEAIGILHEEYLEDYENLITENADEETYDKIVQLAVFGDIVFG